MCYMFVTLVGSSKIFEKGLFLKERDVSWARDETIEVQKVQIYRSPSANRTTLEFVDQVVLEPHKQFI
jgi:hypothetical protein